MNIEKTNEKIVYEVSQWTLLNGAKKLEPYNFIVDIGGKNNGYGEIIINVTDSCVYYLEINYVSYDDNLSFKIDINGRKDNKVYYVNFIKDWSINTPLTYTLPVILKSGENKIKFYGNDNNNAPYLGNFTLILPPTTNNLAEGILENNAYVDLNTGLVNLLGGPKDGSTTININITTAGMYNLLVKYSCYNLSTLKVDVNGIEKNIIYNLIGVNINETLSIKTFTLALNLNKGNNTFKFHGDGIQYGPNLGVIEVSLINNIVTSIFAASKTYNVSSGTLGNGAYLDKTNNVVTNIGGLKDGYSIVKVTTDVLGDYGVKLSYINSNKPLKIDINGIETETIYNITGNKTGVFSISLPLVVGINKIKFHGNGKENAPDLGNFTVNLLKDKSSQIFSGNVFNGGSILPKGILTGLGGISDGSYIMDYVASDFGWYDIYLTVDTSKGSILALDVNLNYNDLIYNIPKAEGLSVFTMSFLLEKGKNTFKFHGDYVNSAPDILKIEIKLSMPIKDSIYNFVDGTLENSATKNLSDNLVSGIGGIDDGIVTIKVNVNEATLYDLNIKYLAKTVDIPLKIDVIDEKKINITTSTICILLANSLTIDSVTLDLHECKITLPLIKGINYIKFYGNGIDKVSSLSYVRINKSDIQKDTGLFSKKYSLVSLAQKMGYEIDKTTPNFVNRIGNPSMRYVKLYLELPKMGNYKIDIKYLKANENEKFDIEFKSGVRETFKPPKTNSLKEDDAKVITFNKLFALNSTIYILAHDSEPTPLLGDLTITEVSLPKITPYTILSIEFHNGVKKYGAEDFITFIGGPKKGFVSLLLKTEGGGYYNLGFKYLCGSNERILKVDVNEKRFTNIYKVPLTQDWEVINAQTFTIPLRLKKGNNTIKLEGDIYNFAPIIGKFNLDFNRNSFSMRYDISTGTLKNGAKVNNYGLVTNIGGPKKGEVSIKVTVKIEGIYNGILEYKPIGKYDNIEIIVNDKIYYFENNMQDEDWSLSDLPTLKTRLQLKGGNNIISFRGLNSDKGESNYAPFLGGFTLMEGYSEFVVNKILNKGSFDLTKGKLENHADVLGDYVTNLGYGNNNSVSISVNVSNSDFYFMTIVYMTYSGSFLRIDVNGQEDGRIYYFEGTPCLHSEEEVKVLLKKGDNIIKFYGVKGALAPNISIISIKKLNI